MKQVGNGMYRLQLPASMSRIHPVFNVVKLTLAPDDPFPGRHAPPPPLPEIIEGEEEWIVEEILDSKVINRKLRYLVKWKDFGIEHNSWEPWDNVHAPELVMDFYQKHPGAARHIRSIEFQSIPFRPIEVPRRHFLKGGVDVRGHPDGRTSTRPYADPRSPTRQLVHTDAVHTNPTRAISTYVYPKYIIPQRRPHASA